MEADKLQFPPADGSGDHIGALLQILHVRGNIIGPQEIAVIQPHNGESDHIKELVLPDLPFGNIVEEKLKGGMPGQTGDQPMDRQTESIVVELQTTVAAGNAGVAVVHLDDVPVMEPVADFVEPGNVGFCLNAVVVEHKITSETG